MDLYIQFRHTRPVNSTSPIGDVITVYETSEIVEPSTGYLSWVKITNLPDTQSRRKLYYLLASSVGMLTPDPDNPHGAGDIRSNAIFEFWNLPRPYKNKFNKNKEVNIPFDVAASLFYNRRTQRMMIEQDFD